MYFIYHYTPPGYPDHGSTCTDTEIHLYITYVLLGRPQFSPFSQFHNFILRSKLVTITVGPSSEVGDASAAAVGERMPALTGDIGGDPTNESSSEENMASANVDLTLAPSDIELA